MRATSTTVIRITAAAEPKGQLREPWNWRAIRVPDHELLAAAEEVGGDEGAEAGDEHEQRAGHDAGQGERQDYLPHHRPAVRIEVVGRFHQPEVQLLDGRVDGKHHEGQVAVDETDTDADVRVRDPERSVDQPHRDEEVVQGTFVSNQEQHRDRADQEVHPVGDGDQEHPHVPLARRSSGDEVSGGEADHEAQGGGAEGLQEGAGVDLQVGGGEDQGLVEDVALEQELHVGVERELPHHPSVGAGGEERIHQHDPEREDEEDADREQRRGEEQCPPPRRAPLPRARRRRSRFGRDHAHQSTGKSRGRLCAQGRMRSSAPATRMTPGSSKRCPTIWTPMGSPSRLKPAGTEMAGH